MKKLFFISCLMLIIAAVACNNNKDPHAVHKTETAKEMYTCPMPEDSVFSDKPGTCPKCGMDLIKLKTDDYQHETIKYTCPMPEDSVFSDKPGTCPKCGMDLIKVETENRAMGTIELESLLKPTNEFVISSIQVTIIEQRGEQIEIAALAILHMIQDR